MNDLDPLSTPSFLIKRAAQMLARQAEIMLRPMGLGMASLPVLVAIKNGRAQTQAELARLLQVEQPSMAQTLARLERDALIRRTADPMHKRVQLVELTATASEQLPLAREVLAEGNAKALRGFSEQEASAFMAFLQRVNANLDDAQ